jgi:flagella synthesis protein FlgN
MTGIPPATLAEFTASLHSERDTMRSFVSLLEAEQQALLDGQTDQLFSLADQKNQTVARLTQLGNARQQFQARYCNTGGSSLENWLQAHAAQELPTWNEIRQLAARAQQLNHVNGEMIQIKLRHNQQALGVLHNAANNATTLYGRDGQPSLPGMGKKLGSV